MPKHVDAVRASFDEPWSDGLPIIVPTPEALDDMITAGGRPPNECLGTVEGRNLSIHVWQAASCAVMAGCLPHYFPVVLATWDAILEPRFNLDGALTSTGGAALAAVVSGPYAEEIGMRSGSGVFGPGNRANATIGRAIRLGCMSALNAIPGHMDAGSFGHGGKYSFHFAESEPPKGWPSLREQLGFPAASTTVTVMPADAPRQIMHRWQPSPEDMLKVVGMSMQGAGILDGDLVAVHRTPEVRSRQIVVARIEDEVTVKRYSQKGNIVWLLPENSDFEPIRVDPREQPFMIEGVVVGVVRAQPR